MEHGEKVPTGSLIDLSEETDWLRKYHNLTGVTRFVVLAYEGNPEDPVVILAEEGTPDVAVLRFNVRSLVWEHATLIS